jgi:hypothetical protein
MSVPRSSNFTNAHGGRIILPDIAELFRQGVTNGQAHRVRRILHGRFNLMLIPAGYVRVLGQST